MKDFYEDFYTYAPTSPAHGEFCDLVFGRDLCQHGFADMEQLALLLDVLQLQPDETVLDIGCGNGMISEALSDETGAHFFGIDYIPLAIEQAQHRTRHKAERLSFFVGDINALDLPEHAYDAAILIDSLYFSDDYARTVRELTAAIRPGGQMAILYSYGREPWIPPEKFPADTLAGDKTPLADALAANGLTFQFWDLTQEDYRLARRRIEVLEALRPRFEEENLMFVYDNRIGDAHGVSQAVEERLHRRYLYLVRLPGE